jgi:hypothetical protein
MSSAVAIVIVGLPPRRTLERDLRRAAVLCLFLDVLALFLVGFLFLVLIVIHFVEIK